MQTTPSYLLLALAAVITSGAVMAQAEVTPQATPKVIQIASQQTNTPVMSHQIASMIQALHTAQAQYRRSGQPQDLARVKAMQRELASLGYGRATLAVPVVLTQEASGVTMQLPAGTSLAD